MINLRQFTADDYEMLNSWWVDSGITGPEPEMYSTETTLIAEVDGVPAVSATIYLTNCKGICYIESFIGNRQVKKSDRNKASRILISSLFDMARGYGYKNIVGFSLNDKLKDYYITFGMNSGPKITSMMRKL